MDIKEFERFVLMQKAVSPEQYDDEYFNKNWRSEGNSYAIETRRLIEGRNPALIKEVFQPKKVLDMGCGPGALMYFLYELGIDCDGVDGSPYIREIAPSEVQDRIAVALATESGKTDNVYDLVISREVLEHLTVLEVRRAVAEMCRVSSRFIYLTTRYHPNPASLLDVTHEFHVDPTHITCLNKDFMRMLFVLEGCRSRPDLEARMDWLNKGRVMVFEKVGKR
jgi:2-polyprenyl-3-methyl-5-hydroxy-6-metoxy-1,4-benzoquinol methylase